MRVWVKTNSHPSCRSISAGIFMIFVVTGTCFAADESTFPRGTRLFDLTTRYVLDIESEDRHILSNAAGAHYFFADNRSLGIELSGYGVFQEPDDTFGIGFAGVFRHHIIDWKHTTLFADVSFGPFLGSDEVPTGGTHFNFITRTGLGISHQLGDNCHMLTGARYWHLSNARLEGIDRNPAINGIEVYFGLGWTW